MNPRSCKTGSGSAPPFPSPRSKPKSSASNSSQQSRTPFQVSVSGSPRYVARPDSPAMTTSPLIGSRIPRKSPGSALAAPGQTGSLLPSRRSAKSRPIYETMSTDIGSATLQNERRDSIVHTNKPLPSPPALQIVDSLSSPKAQRTLIDTEIQATSSYAEWPALSPGNVPSDGDGHSRDSNTANITAPGFPLAESMSLPEQHELTTGVLDYTHRLMTDFHGQKADISSLSPPLESSHTSSEEGFAPNTTIRALATLDEEVPESPLIREVAIPLRISSKRAYGPPFVASQEPHMLHAVTTVAPHRREARMGDTQWPLLKIRGNHHSSVAEPHFEPARTMDLNGNNACTRNAHDMYESMGTKHAANLRASTLSELSWSQATGWSIYNNESQFEESGYRTKRISDHSSKSEPGPLLKISDDADAMLLGKVPPLPENSMRKSKITQGSLSAITSRTVSRLSAGVNTSWTHHTSTKRAATRLSTPGEVRQTSDSSSGTPTQESNNAVRRRSSITPRLATIKSAGSDQQLTTPSSFSYPIRSKTSPALTRLNPRDDASPSHARSTVASSRNTSMLDQRAGLRKPASSPNRSRKLNSEYLQTHSQNSSKPSRKKGKPSTARKEVKPKRSLRNMFSFRDTKEKIPPVPVIPTRSSRLGSAFETRIKKSSAKLRTQRPAGETTRRTVHGRTDNSTQFVPSLKTGSDTRATFAGLHAQRKKGEITRRAVSEEQNGNTQPVQPSSAGLILPGTTAPDAMITINKIMDHNSQLPKTSAVRLRGLEIAQALLASVDACSMAQIAATQAQQSARQAELSMQRSAVELGRLFKLCEGDLDEETVQLIKGLLRNARDSAFPSSASTASRLTPNTQ